MNNSLIDSLPRDCWVEATRLANEGGIQPCYIGALPHQLAALNMRHIGVHQLTVDAALTGEEEYIYQSQLRPYLQTMAPQNWLIAGDS